MTLTINSPANYRIFQRSIGTTVRPMVFTGNCDGVKSVEFRLMTAPTLPITGWTPVTNWVAATVTGTAWEGHLMVDQGGYYMAQVRYADSSQTVGQATVWSVGVLIAFVLSQSNANGLFDQAVTPYNHASGIYYVWNSPYAKATPKEQWAATQAYGIGVLIDKINSELPNLPVGFINCAKNGSTALQWNGGDAYTNWISTLADIGGEVEHFVSIFGETDAIEATVDVNFYGDLKAAHKLIIDSCSNAPQETIFFSINESFNFNNVTAKGKHVISAAQRIYAFYGGNKARYAGSGTGLTTGDGVHYTRNSNGLGAVANIIGAKLLQYMA